MAALPESDARPGLQGQAAELTGLIAARADPEEIGRLTRNMGQILIDAYQVSVVPRKPPDLARGTALYAKQCAGCHGADGRGSRGLGMEPPPINFLDCQRYSRRTLYGLYNTVAQGVVGTSMLAYSELSEDPDRIRALIVIAGNPVISFRDTKN